MVFVYSINSVLRTIWYLRDSKVQVSRKKYYFIMRREIWDSCYLSSCFWVLLFLENNWIGIWFQSLFLYHYMRKGWKFLFGLCRVVLNKVWIMNEMFSISNFMFGYGEIKNEMINYDVSICCSYLIYFLISSYITNGIKIHALLKHLSVLMEPFISKILNTCFIYL